MEIVDIKNQAKNKWYSILTTLGIDESFLTGKHTACPICGPGENSHRFRWDNKEGDGCFICTQCGAGDGFKLLQKVFGMNLVDVLDKVAGVIGVCGKTTPPKKTDINQRKRNLNKLWQASVPLTGSDPVSKYLHSRKLNLRPDNVRYCEKCYEQETGDDFPALVARIQNRDGQPVSIQRIYLDGKKKPFPKMLMPGVEKLSECDGAIRLFFPSDKPFQPDILGIAEGLETALAAAQLSQVACWSCISTSIMEAWTPPEGYQKILIFGDNDNNFAGQKAAYKLAHRLYKKGHPVVVKIPSETGDWNDVLIHKTETT